MPGPRWAVAQRMLRAGSLPADIARAAEVGFDAVGLELPAVLAEGIEAVREALDHHGVRVSSLHQLPVLLDPSAESAALLFDALDAAVAVGSPHLLVVTGPLGRHPSPEADHAVVERLGALGSRAEDLGLRLLLEPTHPLLRSLSYVHSIGHAARLIDGLPGVGLAVDIAHLWWDPDLPFEVAEHVDRIGLVQLADVPTSALDEMRYERGPLGSGDVPVADLVRAFHAAGYHGTYECEILARMPSDERPRLLRDTLAWLHDVGGTW